MERPMLATRYYLRDHSIDADYARSRARRSLRLCVRTVF
jgi:hypothetical protein